MPRERYLSNEPGFLYPDTISLEADLYGVAIEAYDFIHNPQDEKNVYAYNIIFDDKELFSFRMSRFQFDESKYINAHIDYPYYKARKKRYQKAFVDDGNLIPLYSSGAMKGKFFIGSRGFHKLELNVCDYNRNCRSYQFSIRGVNREGDALKQKYLASIRGLKRWVPGRKNIVQLRDLRIALEPGTIADTLFYQYSVTGKIPGSLSPVYHIHENSTPLYKSFDISIRTTQANKKLRDKLCLGLLNGDDRIRYVDASFDKNWVKGKASIFGNYLVSLDTIAPRIRLHRDFPHDSVQWNFEIKDDFSGISTYNGYLNDHWILLDYDPKFNLLSYRFDDVLLAFLKEQEASGIPLNQIRFPLRIEASDRKGNKCTWEKAMELPANFLRSP
jgi:hypothetical protein